MGRGGAVHAPAMAPVHGAPMAAAQEAPQGRAALSVVAGGAPAPAVELDAVPAVDPVVAEALKALPSFEAVVEMIRERRDARLLVDVETGMRLVSYAPGRIAFQPTDRAPKSLSADLAQRLQVWTGQRWVISVENGPGAATVAETREAAKADLHASLRLHPLVKAALDAFPGAEIRATRELIAADPGAAGGDPGMVEDPMEDWDPVDPFDDEPI
jgi:DNA polymerase-3 subunit gamma/tau